MERASLLFGNHHPGVVDASLRVDPPAEEQLRDYLTGEFAHAYSSRLRQMQAGTQSAATAGCTITYVALYSYSSEDRSGWGGGLT